MARLKRIKADTKKVNEGIWVPYALDIELCIASIDNKNYKKARKKLLEEHRDDLTKDNDVTPEEILNICKPAIAEHILVGWKNIEDDDSGEPLKYSPEKALEIFNDSECFDLFDFVLKVSQQRANYRYGALESGVGN